jgi:hypothetical protein
MKLKLKGCRFDTSEEIQAISPRVLDTLTEKDFQEVLDTLTEKDFQEAFQTWKRCWDRCLHVGGNYSESDGGR